MRKLLDRLNSFWREDPGQDLIEYSLLIAFVAMVSIGVLLQLGVTAQGPWAKASTTFASAGGTSTAPTTTTPPRHGDDGDGRDGH